MQDAKPKERSNADADGNTKTRTEASGTGDTAKILEKKVFKVCFIHLIVVVFLLCTDFQALRASKEVALSERTAPRQCLSNPRNMM
jgi:hypothetical protein